jgi:ABC-2 type transport system permease protein
VGFSTVVLEAPYGQLSLGTCLVVLTLLALGLFVAIRPLLDRKLN